MKNKYPEKGFKLFIFICIFLIYGSIIGFSQELGDVNCSGSVDIVDALLVALNVQDTPGDYTTFPERPIPSSSAAQIGMLL